MKKPSRYTQERQMLKNKPRKVLNLQERVQAIQLYEQNPIYQRVASTFKCSWEQIKNVIANRESILLYYARCQTIEPYDNERLVRQKKINFLGHVMFEYILRANYHRSIVLTDLVIRERALEFRNLIDIERFHPNRAWIEDFKHVYNIDLHRLNTLVITKTPQRSLNSNEIIAYCTQEVERAKQAGNTHELGKNVGSRLIKGHGSSFDDNGTEKFNDTNAYHEEGDEMRYDYDEEEREDESNLQQSYDNLQEWPTTNFDTYNDDEMMDDIKPDIVALALGMENKSKQNADIDAVIKLECPSGSNSPIPPMPKPTQPPTRLTIAKNLMPTSSATNITSTSTAPAAAAMTVADVDNYAEALKRLRPLEQFAIQNEDFRAMNLLTQLEEFYEKAMKRQRKK